MNTKGNQSRGKDGTRVLHPVHLSTAINPIQNLELMTSFAEPKSPEDEHS